MYGPAGLHSNMIRCWSAIITNDGNTNEVAQQPIPEGTTLHIPGSLKTGVPQNLKMLPAEKILVQAGDYREFFFADFSFGSFLFFRSIKREKNMASFGREAGSQSVPSVFSNKYLKQ
jgi:hypothetical protein